eukprot:CAMPEP_0114256390 /NCGR_PEP_ID=MMETSP0058-20121206/18125_1 /TAXON_ID=36894 /ORGANISM="Pyramimonas parkeae, CCMP726" /LENGTH=253 /DNA_ID=CAMNT_0001370949 /DNA_START=133 /DNA_END=891 /DNA_ORIENTATION=-
MSPIDPTLDSTRATPVYKHPWVVSLCICSVLIGAWIHLCLHPRTESYFSFPFSFKAEYSKTEPSTTYETLQLQLNPTRVGSASSSRIEAGSTKIPLLQHRANATSGRLALLFFGRVGNSLTSAGRAKSDLAAPKAAWESIQQHVIAPNLLEGVATDVFIHCWDGAFEAELNKMYQPTGMEYQPPRSFHSHPWIDKHMSMFKVQHEKRHALAYAAVLLIRPDTYFRRGFLVSSAPLRRGVVITGTQLEPLRPME